VLADDCDLELIVVDDGSPEPVEALLSHVDDPRLRVIRVEHGGLSRARNVGISDARGDYVRFADADDLVEPGSTSALLQLADEKTIVYGATQVCDESLQPLSTKSSWLEGWIAEACLLYRFDVVHTSLLFPRGVLERVGSFEPDLRQCQDWDFVLRACEVAPVRGSQAVVTRYRRHGSSASANVQRALHFESVVVDRYFERNPAQAGSRLEREARAKLLMVHAKECPRLGEGRLEQLRLVLRAFALHPRRTIEELGRLTRLGAA
jgi:glycosyltransferase involved in cell wall biosynthesis